MLEEMLKPGKEDLKFYELPKDVQILMKNVPLDFEDLNLDTVIKTVKSLFPYLWTYSSRNQIFLAQLLMADAYVQGVIDGKRAERAKIKARKEANK